MRWALIALLVATVVAVAAQPPVNSDHDAIDRFITAWAADVRPTVKGHKDPLIGSIDASMREPKARERYRAELTSCRNATRDIEDLMAQSHYNFVLYGSMAAAHKLDKCWAVKYSCCMKGDAAGVVDPATGALVVVWRIPEG